jgi:heme/copper-type cytochrome/quinol oxidase subunit 2
MKHARTSFVLLLAVLGVMALMPAFAAGSPQPVTITMYSFGHNLPSGAPGKPGPDGMTHDAIVPSDIIVQPGQQVTIKVINYDEGPHTFTVPSLNLNEMIQAGNEDEDTGKVTPVTTTFTFTAPDKSGTYRWHCTVPCDGHANGWAMTDSKDGPGQDGYMAGYVIVN